MRELIKKISVAIYGPRWRSGLADLWGVHPQNARKIIDGKIPLTPERIALVEKASSDKVKELSQLIKEIK